MASKIKKLTALLLTAMMAATAMVGCNNGGDGDEPVAPATESTTSTASEGQAIDITNPETKKFIIDTIADGADNGKVALTVWAAGEDLDFEKSRIEEFKKDFADPRITYDIKVRTKGEDKAGGAVIESPQKAADIFSFADDQLSELLKAGAIAKVPSYYLATVKAENSEDSIGVSTIDSTLYAYPKTSDNGYFLYYDKSVLSEDDVKSMDTMIAKAAAKGKNVFFSMSNAWYETGFFFTAGCTIKYENKVQTATLNSDEGLAAAKAMCHIAENKDKGFKGDAGNIGENGYIPQGFQKGELAAAVIGTWVGPQIKEILGDNTGAAKLPTVLINGAEKQLESFCGYKLIGVNVNSKQPFAAHTLAYYLGNEASQLARYEARGLLPTNKGASDNEKVKTDPAFKAIEDQRPFSHPQGTSVGGAYWGSGVGSLGGDIVNAAGKLTDDELKLKLKSIEDNMKIN